MTEISHVERVIGDAVFILLCCCDDNPDNACEDGCAPNEHYSEIGQAVLAALRDLPVEERMEAMGMKKQTFWRPGFGNAMDTEHVTWVPA